MFDVFVMDALCCLLDSDYSDALDDAAFGQAVRSQAAYLAGLALE